MTDLRVKKHLHTRMRVSDLDETIRFYTTVLGLEVIERKTSPRGSHLAFLKVPNSDELIELTSFPPSGQVKVREDLVHLAFQVESLDETIALLNAQGVKITDGPTTTSSGSRFIFIDAPDGYFKEVNDTYGHHFGDLLLAKIGVRLKAQLRDSDTIARLGGDEFAVLLGGVGIASDAERVANNLLLALEQPIVVEGEPLSVGGSIGIVHCPLHGAGPATLLRRADVAMYAAKSGRVGVRHYAPEMDQHSPARMQLVAELRAGMDDRHLVLHYQPEVAAADGRVVRVEALLRWRRADGMLLQPGEFLPLIESGELMDRVTRWVIDAAVRDCRAWRDAGHPIGVSVNLAPRNLRDPELPKAVARTLTAHGLPAEALTLEITESGVLGDATLAAEVCRALRETGVGLSLDDFGTGYSSLMHLKHLPLTELKVDRAFTAGMIRNEHDAAIVRSIIDLGHELGRTIVAEGVEDAETLERLRAQGCDLVQGFHISKPLAGPYLRDWLRSRTPA